MNSMQKRRACRKVTLGDDRVGRVSIGGDAPIAVQSMCSVYTHDIDACLAEIRKLYPMDPSIDPSGDGLPRIETDARTRIRNQQTKLLIMSGGEEFEVLILLTQEKATDYIESICRSLSKADPQKERSKMLAGMADGWMELNRRARSLFLIKDDVEIPGDKD